MHPGATLDLAAAIVETAHADASGARGYQPCPVVDDAEYGEHQASVCGEDLLAYIRGHADEDYVPSIARVVFRIAA